MKIKVGGNLNYNFVLVENTLMEAKVFDERNNKNVLLIGKGVWAHSCKIYSEVIQ